MLQPPTVDSVRTRIATLIAQQQSTAAEGQRSEEALKVLGWDPATETVEQFSQRKQSEAEAMAAAAATKLAELDVLVGQYEEASSDGQ